MAEPSTRRRVGVLMALGLTAAVCYLVLFAPEKLVDETELPFDSYGGYFVSNKFEPDAAESFVIINSQKQFQQIFGVAMVMGDKSHRLPEGIFRSNVVLAAVKRGGSVWEFQVERVSEGGGLVRLHYLTTATPSDSASFACPLIVSIPRGEYQTVQFVENGKPAKTVKISENPEIQR